MVLRTSSILIFVLIPSAGNNIIIRPLPMGPIVLVVMCVLLGKLASLAHTPRGQLPSQCIGSLHAKLVASSHPLIRHITAA
jgi:hypothetical protein